MNHEAYLHPLARAGLIDPARATFTALTGGVSSEILLIEDGRRRLVVKRALEKLKVKDDWHADTRRNRVEQEYLRFVGRLMPEAVPRLLYADAEAHFFAMEHLGEGFTVWKTALLAGQADPAIARRAGAILGRIHATTCHCEVVRAQFDTTPNFHQLRTSPYLLTTGERHPRLRAWFEAEADRLEATREALVHGDYSPKNLLVGRDRLVVLDCEVAWYGDPAFDAAFLLNHLFLKSLHRLESRESLLRLVAEFWTAYSSAAGPEVATRIAQRLPRLLLMLMLARIDGKSPVEYLVDPHKQDCVRSFVTSLLPEPPPTLEALLQSWRGHLARTFPLA